LASQGKFVAVKAGFPNNDDDVTQVWIIEVSAKASRNKNVDSRTWGSSEEKQHPSARRKLKILLFGLCLQNYNVTFATLIGKQGLICDFCVGGASC